MNCKTLLVQMCNVGYEVPRIRDGSLSVEGYSCCLLTSRLSALFIMMFEEGSLWKGRNHEGQRIRRRSYEEGDSTKIFLHSFHYMMYSFRIGMCVYFIFV
ncbi:Uncharacterised protein [Chlamydia trachomatis]|nr:Uncharacterised protein [Chlamydia trachomatis]CQB85243.1 Uncharacterised protein [Chlamydia trachomatis]